MRFKQFAIYVMVLAATAGASSAAHAGSKVIQRYFTIVDDDGFKILRYANGSAKVTQTAMVGDTESVALRDRMRRAAKQATGCELSDDFWLNGRLVGNLSCGAVKEGEPS